MTTEDRVKRIVADHLGVAAAEVTPEASFVDNLGADCLDTVELSMAVEDEFGIELNDDGLSQVQTVGDAVRLIERAMAGRVS